MHKKKCLFINPSRISQYVESCANAYGVSFGLTKTVSKSNASWGSLRCFPIKFCKLR